MFLNNYPIKTSYFTKPKFLKGLKSAPAILLLHGFSGSPMELTWLGRQLNDAGYTVSIPRLPGHGTNKQDFLDSSWMDWLRVACEEYINLSAEYESVYIGGHSMGGLLASIIAARFNPEKLLLFAPAFYARDKRIFLTPLLKYFIKEKKVESKSFYTDPEFLKAQSDYIGVRYISKVADLYKLQKMARKNLSYVKAESLIVFSKKDASVPMTVKTLLEDKLKAIKTYLILDESSHNVVDDCEKEIVAKKVIEFLKQ